LDAGGDSAARCRHQHFRAPDFGFRVKINYCSKLTCNLPPAAYVANCLRYVKRQFNRFGKSALAALLVGMVLLLDAMAAAPALHELIHKDADQAGHQCAVTMFAHGKVDSAAGEAPVVLPAALLETTPQIEFSIITTAIEDLPPGRGPPAAVSSQA
jgi:hypothetical protein